MARSGRPQLMAEAAVLKKVWARPDRRLVFTNHARTEMRADRILEADVRHVIDRCRVTWIETKRDVLWHVEGSDVDGKAIRLVLAVDEAEIVVKVVTAMAL